jgi:chemotaxis protein MotA
MFVIVGYILAIINLLVVIAMTTDTLKIYFDFHAFLCVGGGTIISVIIGFKPHGLKRIMTLYKIATKKEENPKDLISEIVRVAKETRGEVNQKFLANYRSQHFFLKDGLQLIADGFNEDQIVAIMSERIQAVELRYKEDEKFIKAVAKIPPSFGLMGTTIGLIALFAQVGTADAMKKIGPAMAVAMTATLYGLLFAFAMLNPMIDRVIEMNAQNVKMREIILKGVIQLKGKNSPIYIEEVLKSYLSFAAQKTFAAKTGGGK